jgi:SAM-dependent methyltransferase
MAQYSNDGSVSFKELERQGWTAKASDYDAWLGTITRRAVQSLLEATQVSAGMNVLDVACGPGYGAAQAMARGATAIGIDFSPTMIAEAKRRFPGIEFREGDAENLAFSDACFDAVICAFGLLHMAEPERAIGEVHRVLRPGARYSFSVWAGPDKHECLALVLHAIQTYGRMDVPLPPAPPIFRFSDPEECSRVLTDAGFVDVSVRDEPLVWQFNSPEAVIDMLYKSTVRAAMLLGHQAPEARERIHRAILDGVAQFARQGSYTLNFPAVIAAARKP